MLRHLGPTVLLLASSLFVGPAFTTKLSAKEYETFTGGGLKERRGAVAARSKGNPYINIVKGIFNSDKGNLVRNLADIPCDVVQSLESDADAAEQFVSQIQAGEIPSLLTDLPEDAISEFGAIINVATQVIVDVAEAAVTDVVQVFDDIEDGHIVSALVEIPEDIISGIIEGWKDFTSEAENIWDDVTCFFKTDCTTTTTAPSCEMPATASATTTEESVPSAPSESLYTSYLPVSTTLDAPMEPQPPESTPKLVADTTQGEGLPQNTSPIDSPDAMADPSPSTPTPLITNIMTSPPFTAVVPDITTPSVSTATAADDPDPNQLSSTEILGQVSGSIQEPAASQSVQPTETQSQTISSTTQDLGVSPDAQQTTEPTQADSQAKIMYGQGGARSLTALALAIAGLALWL